APANTEENVLVVAGKLAATAKLAARNRLRTTRLFFIVDRPGNFGDFVAARAPSKTRETKPSFSTPPDSPFLLLPPRSRKYMLWLDARPISLSSGWPMPLDSVENIIQGSLQAGSRPRREKS